MKQPYKCTLQRHPSLLKTARILDALRQRPRTTAELTELLCVTPQTGKLYVKILRERKQIHIKRWTREGVLGMTERPREVWDIGNMKDAKRPRPFNRSELGKRRMDRLKQDPERYQAFLLAARARSQRLRFKPRPDIAAAWIPQRERMAA